MDNKAYKILFITKKSCVNENKNSAGLLYAVQRLFINRTLLMLRVVQ